MPILYAVIITAALSGLALAGYIRFKKRRNEALVCPIGAACDTVIHSDYSCFMTIPVELLGIVYYASIVTSYLVFAAYPSLASGFSITVLLVLTTLAFAFSVYLTSVQAFVLKCWCTWCLISAALCAVIFFSALAASRTVPLL